VLTTRRHAGACLRQKAGSRGNGPNRQVTREGPLRPVSRSSARRGKPPLHSASTFLCKYPASQSASKVALLCSRATSTHQWVGSTQRLTATAAAFADGPLLWQAASPDLRGGRGCSVRAIRDHRPSIQKEIARWCAALMLLPPPAAPIARWLSACPCPQDDHTDYPVENPRRRNAARRNAPRCPWRSR